MSVFIGHVRETLTSVVGMSILPCVALRSKAGQTVVCDLQDEAIVNDTVGRLQFTVREDDAVVQEQHSLKADREEPKVLSMYSKDSREYDIVPLQLLYTVWMLKTKYRYEP